MNRNRLTRLIIIAAALNLFGCAAAAEKGEGDGKTAAAQQGVNAPSPTPAALAAATPANPNPAPASAANEAVARQGTPPASESRGAGGAPPAKMPTPQIGSGGNDFFLFTQARAAVNADPELRAANLIIEVKDGVVTLNGTVASAALKAKAEELTRGAGPKEIRNQLRVANGK